MTALAADTKRKRRITPLDMVHEFSVSGSTQIYAGSAVVLNGGYLEPATTATGLVAVGVATENVNNTGADGAVTCKAIQSIWKLANSAGGDAIAADDRGDPCYFVDDNTVALTDDSSSRSLAGTIYDVAADGEVYVLITLVVN